MIQTKRVAIYCRVSTADQSCERQERELKEYAARAGWEIVGIYKETASGTKNDRAKRKEVLALAQARKLDVILVTEMTRFGRSTQDLMEQLQKLMSVNVSLIAQTGFTFDLSNPQGRLIASIMASLAEFERDVIAERVKSGLANAKAKGVKLGRQSGDNVVQDKVEARVIAMIAEGLSYRATAEKLGISPTTVLKIMKRHKTQTAKPEAARELVAA
ncbi:MAG: recombinase family protein [Candidatus Obscuribacter sp.]|nr:recombinase family protein [Candidatus Obscuribacter sp.]